MWRKLEQLFTFTRNERWGIIILLLLSIFAIFFQVLYPYYSKNEDDEGSDFTKEIEQFSKEFNEQRQPALSKDSLNQADSSNYFVNPFSASETHHRYAYNGKKNIQYFVFDPNTIGVTEWEKLGFSKKQAEAIERIKSNGFIFYKTEDLLRLKLIGEANYPRLAPYVVIDSTKFPKKEFKNTQFSTWEFEKRAPVESPRKKYVIDINTADSSLFERQRGIGPSLASRIIKYRNRLGGFVSVDQIKEVWGLPDSTYQNLKDRFVVENDTINLLNVNTADFKQLGTHPYINFTYAKIILAYRKEHGSFSSVDDFRKGSSLSDSLIKKLIPYITF